MNGCRYEHKDRKCYHPNMPSEYNYENWCVEGVCHLKEPDIIIDSEIDEENRDNEKRED